MLTLNLFLLFAVETVNEVKVSVDNNEFSSRIIMLQLRHAI